MDILHAPALQHLEITAPRYYQMGDDYNRIDGYYSLLDAIDLSMFTHLYLGYSPNRDMDNPTDGCIWASVGPSTIPCVTNRSSFFCHGHRTTWPSSWSVFPQFPDSDDQVEPLVHIHTLRTYTVDADIIHLPCKLISRMTMLDTVVLCLPGEPYPRYRNGQPECRDFQLTKLFHEIAQSSLNLRNLIIRAGHADEEDVEILSECFSQEYWTSLSCPLLESITYYTHTDSIEFWDVFWELWIKFLTSRKSIGRPLKHLHFLDYPSPSGEALSLKGLSDTEITMTSQYQRLFEYVRIPDNGWEDEEHRPYPCCGFP